MSDTVALVGTGPDPETPSYEGFAMAYRHAEAYQRLDDLEVAACADIVPEHAEAFAGSFGIPEDGVFEDHGALLEAVDPDVVSVCVPPAAHAEIVVDCARAGVGAVHCEKPMADTWGRSRLMAREADRHGTRLTFNHQRRFKPSWRRAKELLGEGQIGDLRRVETRAPNLYDWGTHCLDTLGWYVGDVPAEWVLVGLDYREEDVWFGQHNENQAVAQFAYENGVHGVMYTGQGASILDGRHRLVGTAGTIEVDPEGADLRVRRHGEGVERIECEAPDASNIDRAIADVVGAYREGRASRLDADNALNATEIIFGAWESVRRRGRVDLPLEAEDNALEAMVEAGDLAPE
ncbi:MAG: Gfo/Idh/MocA family protein [Halobacteriales archaeon]